MIVKLTKKDIIAIGYITLLSIVAVVYAFSVIPSPATERTLATDHKRVSDLGEIQLAVDNYYQTNNTLPQSLDNLTTLPYSTSTPLEKTDPQTHQPYEYSVTGPYSYKLCATFATDSSKEKPNQYDDINVSYPMFSGDFSHPVGHFCFAEKEQPPYNPHPSIFPCTPGKMCPLLPTTKSGASPSAILSSFNDNGDCAWTPTFYVKGFAPYSQIHVSAQDSLANQCTKKPNQKMTESTTLNEQTSAEGDVLLAYPSQLTYGEFTYTFTDDQGQSASVHFTYDGKSLRPTILPNNK